MTSECLLGLPVHAHPGRAKSLPKCMLQAQTLPHANKSHSPTGEWDLLAPLWDLLALVGTFPWASVLTPKTSEQWEQDSGGE